MLYSFSTVLQNNEVPHVCMYTLQNQKLMSDKAAKEHVTTTYYRVPSKSKTISEKIPNMETSRSIGTPQ